MFKNYDLENDISIDVTEDATSVSVTSSSTATFDVDYYRASISSLTGMFNNIKNTFYNSSGTSMLTSLYDSSTTNSVAVVAIGDTLVKDGISASSNSGVGSVSFTLRDGTVTGGISIVDYQDSTTLQSLTNPEYYGKLIDASTSATTKLVYGEIFYNYGLIVLHGFQANNSLSSTLKNVTSTVSYNASPTGSNIGIALLNFKNITEQSRQIFFTRLFNKEFNYSNNPTFSDDFGVINDSLTADPFTYITTVGLYNDQNQLLAVAKMSQPQKKDFNEEIVLKIALQF